MVKGGPVGIHRDCIGLIKVLPGFAYPGNLVRAVVILAVWECSEQVRRSAQALDGEVEVDCSVTRQAPTKGRQNHEACRFHV